MSTDRDKALCYAVMSGPDAACAVCVIDGTPEKELGKFLKGAAGSPVQTVTVVEARRLLGNYFSRKPGQLDLEQAIAETT
jgi:hypothetical protein